jgi:copper chaperone NosL
MKTYTLSLLIVLLLSACTIAPAKMNYGEDHCHFCKMTIVDRQHAAQVVTGKGKAFKYDAIECMMNHLARWDQVEPGLFLVNDFTEPGKLVDATNSHYLICREIPSPMGAFLSGFSNAEVRDGLFEEKGGEALDWNGLLVKFQVNL